MKRVACRLCAVVWVCGALSGVASEAWGCSVAELRPHQADPLLAPEDETPPPPVTELKARVLRGRLPGGCADEASSCDDLGFVNLTFEPPADPETPPGLMGYIIVASDGAPPESLNLPDGPVRPDFGGQLSLVWNDRESVRDALDFTLTVFPVDQVGNVGEGTDVRVRDPETPSCRLAPGAGSGSAPWVLLVVGLGWAASRRRRA